MVGREEIEVQMLYAQMKERLSGIIEAPEFEARQILSQIFGVSYNDILIGARREVAKGQLERLWQIVSRRREGYPLQYLLGEWDFFGRAFFVGEGVLIPRADTEVLVEQALQFLRPLHRPRVLDLCSGSGCIGVTIALEQRDAQVTAVEKSPKAFDYLLKNNERLKAGVHCVLGDALEENTAEGCFDLIVSNPPYLTEKDMGELQTEVDFEPKEALYGREDGLFFYRELTEIYALRLRTGGMLAYEIGEGQQKAVEKILRGAHLNSICQIPDYNGIIRCVTARRL